MLHVRWFGQSAFLLTGTEGRVFVDPFGKGMSDRAKAWNSSWDYPEIEVVGGDPRVIRGAGTHESPIGEIVGVNSEHDTVAGTQRGPNTIFRFSLDGVRVAHFGDFGQLALRPEQRAALADVDAVFFPVGAGPTTPPAEGADLLRDLAPSVLVPMHYRSNRISFLEPRGAEGGRGPRVLKLTFT